MTAALTAPAPTRRSRRLGFVTQPPTRTAGHDRVETRCRRLRASGSARTQDEIEALDDAIRAACPAADSTEYREDPAGHRTCPR